MGIEPTLSAWKAEVLPLNYTRISMVEGVGFEPTKPKQQIYSLPPLTTREPLPKCKHVFFQNPHYKSRKVIQYILILRESWRSASNQRPADYKSAALPTELRQHSGNIKVIIRNWQALVNNKQMASKVSYFMDLLNIRLFVTLFICSRQKDTEHI